MRRIFKFERLREQTVHCVFQRRRHRFRELQSVLEGLKLLTCIESMGLIDRSTFKLRNTVSLTQGETQTVPQDLLVACEYLASFSAFHGGQVSSMIAQPVD